MTVTHPDASSDLMSCSQVENQDPVANALTARMVPREVAPDAGSGTARAASVIKGRRVALVVGCCAPSSFRGNRGARAAGIEPPPRFGAAEKLGLGPGVLRLDLHIVVAGFVDASYRGPAIVR